MQVSITFRHLTVKMVATGIRYQFYDLILFITKLARKCNSQSHPLRPLSIRCCVISARGWPPTTHAAAFFCKRSTWLEDYFPIFLDTSLSHWGSACKRWQHHHSNRSGIPSFYQLHLSIWGFYRCQQRVGSCTLCAWLQRRHSRVHWLPRCQHQNKFIGQCISIWHVTVSWFNTCCFCWCD